MLHVSSVVISIQADEKCINRIVEKHGGEINVLERRNGFIKIETHHSFREEIYRTLRKCVIEEYEGEKE